MVWDWDINGINKLSFLFFLFMAIQSKAQTESPNQTVPEEELITESVELNEEISIHIMNKINIYDFLNDVELSSFMLNDNQRKALIEHKKYR